MNTYNIDKMYESYSSEIEKMQKCIDELQEENSRYERKNQKYKKVIDKLKELIIELYDNTDDITCYDIDKDCKNDLLDILKEVK